MASSSASNELDSLFERAKSYLMQANKDGVSVYDQLARFMELLMDENPEDVAHDPTKFNEIFTFIQKYSFMRGESTATCNEPAPIPPQELERLGQNNTLFLRPPPEVQTTIEQPDPYTTITTTTTKPLTAPKYESVAQQNRFWMYAGYGMSEEDAFLVDRSITKLAMEKGLQDVRFVGKIFGTRSDYYIISTRRYVEEGEKIYQEVNTMPKPPRKKVEVPVQAEPGFVGVNRLSFWVTTHPASDWVVLPDVAPEQINAARYVKRLFSGDLTADVISSPPFPWKEEVYLRAQLARITSSTYVVPQGALEEPEEEGEDDDEDEEDEEGPRKPKEAKYRPLTVISKEFGEEEIDVAQFATLDQWVHGEAYIYKNGRQTKVPEKPEPEEEEEEEEQPQEPEEEEEEAEEVEEEEEEEKELFAPIRGDYLYSVVDIPQPPPPEDEEEEEEEEEEQQEQPEEQPPEDNTPLKPIADEEVADDDVTKMKMAAWTVRLVNNISKTHRVVVVQSLRWPGAIGYIGENGKFWGCGYFGNGLKKTDFAFTPIPAPPILSECADITEVMDPTAATEKLVRRGEEPPEPDSEDELEEAEEDEEM